MKKLVCLIISVMMLLGVTAGGQMNTMADDKETVTLNINGSYGQTEARSMLAEINEFRHSDRAWYWNSDNTTKTVCSGLSDLVYDYDLEKAAMKRAAEIAVDFSHTRPNGKSCFTVEEANPFAENIAAGSSTASGAFTQWEEADEGFSGQGHRRSMLSSSYTSIGIGHYVLNGMHYWVQEFSYTKPTAMATPANDSATDVPVEIVKSNITEAKAMFTSDSISVKEDKTANIPASSPVIATKNHWPSYYYITFRAEPVYSGYDSAVISLKDNRITGLKKGSTTVNVAYNTELGELTAKLSVTVTEKDTTTKKASSSDKKETTEKKTSESDKASGSKTAISVNKVSVKKSAKKLVIRAVVKVNGKLASGKKVTFKFNGKKYVALTNKKGVAKITIKKAQLKKLKIGKKITYQVTCGKASVKRTVKVK